MFNELGTDSNISSLFRGFCLARQTAGTLWHFCEGRFSTTGYRHLQELVELLTAHEISLSTTPSRSNGFDEHALSVTLYRLDTGRSEPTTDELITYLCDLRTELLAIIAADRTTLKLLPLRRLERTFRDVMEALEPKLSLSYAG